MLYENNRLLFDMSFYSFIMQKKKKKKKKLLLTKRTGFVF